MASILEAGVQVGDTHMAARELFGSAQLQERIRVLANEIAGDYAERGSVHTVTVLNG